MNTTTIGDGTGKAEATPVLHATDLVAAIHEIGPEFAVRATEHDAEDSFAADDFAELKARGFLSAGVPADLGGGDAEVRQLGDMLRVLAHYSPSTALALSMHTHQVAMAAWRWRHESGFGETLLRRVADQSLVLVSSGGSDWLHSSGTLEKVDGGYRMHARKSFASGSPAGDILVTSAVYDDPTGGPTVLHFGLPFKTAGVSTEETWRTLGMRGTGSNDVVVDGAFIPEAAISGRRPKRKWGPFHLVSMLALPLIYSVYVGIAEAARELALTSASKRSNDANMRQAVAEMENQLRAAQIALESAISLAESAQPGPAITNEALIRRTLVGEAAIRAVEKAMEVTGGTGFYRAYGLERLFRDVQAARYHPLTKRPQLDYTGAFALGLPVE